MSRPEASNNAPVSPSIESDMPTFAAGVSDNNANFHISFYTHEEELGLEALL